MDQAVSRRDAVAEAQVRSQFTPCEFCGGKLALRVFRLPVSVSLH